MHIFVFLLLFLSIAQPITKCSLEEATRSMNRPEKEAFSLSPTGHFMIHYDIEGDAAPELTDNNANGVPDYIDEVGIIADSTRKVLTEVMGFRTEVDDSDGIYDIYIMAFGTNYYGVNVHEGGGKSYIKIDNDYASGFYTTGIQVMRLTVAHEFFHAIQRAYKETQSMSDQFFYELTSTWIEDIIVPDGDDYLYWLNDFFNNPQQSWDQTDGYSLALFGHYLSTQFEDITTEKESTIMREIWENISNANSPYEILNGILQDSFESSFQEAWLGFVSRNMFNDIFTDMDNDMFYYIDQGNELCTTPPFNSTFMNSEDDEQFNISVDNKSVQIISIESRDDLVIQLNMLQSGTNYLSNVLSLKASQNEYFIDTNLQIDFNIQEIYNLDKIQFLYIGDDYSSNIVVQVEASLQFCNDGVSEEAVIDLCGVCGGDNSTCTDCNGDLNGEAYIDGCEECVGGETQLLECPVDCMNVFGGGAWFNSCGDCVPEGDESCVQGCDGQWNNNGVIAQIDECGVCDLDPLNDCIQDCYAVWGGEAFIDGCGDCVGGETGVDSCPYKLVSIYPNPIYAGDAVMLILDIEKSIIPQIIIYNLLGLEVLRTSMPSLSQGRHEVPLYPILPTHLASGIYLMDVILDNKIFTRKFTLIK